jgi:hypothetical protein
VAHRSWRFSFRLLSETSAASTVLLMSSRKRSRSAGLGQTHSRRSALAFHEKLPGIINRLLLRNALASVALCGFSPGRFAHSSSLSGQHLERARSKQQRATNHTESTRKMWLRSSQMRTVAATHLHQRIRGDLLFEAAVFVCTDNTRQELCNGHSTWDACWALIDDRG